LDDIHGLKPFMLFTPDLKRLALIAVALVAAWLLVRWWLARRRRRPAAVAAPAAAPMPAAQPPRSALRQLEELAGKQHIEAGRAREFHATLSAIVRAYLGARFELPARRMTTTELLGALGGRTQIDDGVYRRLADLLPGCDLAKFAGFKPSAAEMGARLATAREIVEALGDLAVAADEDDGRHDAAPRVGGAA
jgi:hypothetical protein